jgi:hypothetical protein
MANKDTKTTSKQAETVTEQGAQGQQSTDMQASDFKALRVAADDVTLRDAHLGQLLHAIIGHLGHAFGLDAAEEDAKEQAQIDEAAELLKDEGVPVLNDANTRTKVNPSTSVTPGTPDADTNPIVNQVVKEDLGTEDQGKEDKK